MNPKERRSYWLQIARIQRKIELEYIPKVQRILEGQKKKFIDTAERDQSFNKAISDMALEIWNQDLADTIKSLHKKSGLTFANLTYGSLKKRYQKGFGFNEEFAQAIINELGRYGLEFVALIDEETKKVILEQIQKGAAEGLTFQQIVDNIKTIWVADEWRALRIVRTESMRAANVGHMVGAKKLNFEVEKVWIAAKDHRTRRQPKDVYDHWVLDGTTKNIDEPWMQLGMKGVEAIAMQPGDRQAPAGFTVNCRCTVAFQPKRDEQGNLIMKR